MTEVKEIPIDEIKVGEYEQRLEIDDEGIDGLAASIRRIGVVQPLMVKKEGDTFHLVAGHRRLLAAKRVGLQNLPCIIRDGPKGLQAEVAFAENFFRKDLSPVELAAAISDCIEQGNMTFEELAAFFHRSVEWVVRMKNITGWPSDVLAAVHEKVLSVSAAHNLALVTDDSYRAFLVRNAVEQGATARTTAAWLQAWRSMQPPEEAILSEPVNGRPLPQPSVPQAPCFCCSQVFMVNEMSHVPVCGGCIQLIRKVGVSGG